MGNSMPERFFIPTEVPWQDLKGKDLEELLYWLFDSMGAKDLEWRVGGVRALQTKDEISSFRFMWHLLMET